MDAVITLLLTAALLLMCGHQLSAQTMPIGRPYVLFYFSELSETIPYQKMLLHRRKLNVLKTGPFVCERPRLQDTA